MTLVDSSATGLPPVRGLVALGRWSYSLYLWHMILIHATPWVRLRPQVAELLAVSLAAASYRYVELPFLAAEAAPREGRSRAGSRRPLAAAPALAATGL